MYRDRILSAVNAKEEHTVHPHGYFSGWQREVPDNQGTDVLCLHINIWDLVI